MPEEQKKKTKKKKNDILQFFEDMVQAYMCMFVKVLWFVRESTKDQECVKILIISAEFF